MDQLLMSKIRANIVVPLQGLVEWDRYGIHEEDSSGFIFGWITRDDKFYDFVVFRFWIDWDKAGQFFCSYDTSSKKYTKEIGYRLGNDMKGHADCRPASEILPETYLVKWQKKPIEEMPIEQKD